MNLDKCKRIVISLASGGLLVVALSALLCGKPQIARADPGDLFVTPGGGGDCSQAAPCDLPTALIQAGDTDTIYLAQGTYTGIGGAVVTVTKSITLSGGWDGTTTTPLVRDPETYRTILNGEGSRRVIYITGTVAPTIEGFIITGGEASGMGGRPQGSLEFDAGGGVYSYNASPVIVNNVITDNLASRSTYACGGGIYLYNGDGSVIHDNTIISNTGTLSPTDGYGAGLYLDKSDATVTDNDFVGNFSSLYGLGQGGGLYLLDSDATVTGNEVVSNTASGTDSGTGGGLYLRYSDATVSGNTVVSNVGSIAGTGQGGGIYVNRSAATVSANIIQGNAGSVTGYGLGGGIRLGFSPALIDGNTVVSNRASVSGNGAGGGLYVWRSRPFTVTNNLIARNRAREEGDGVSVQAHVAALPSGGVLVHNTIADNGLGDAGVAVWVGQHSAITLTNNIICSHTVGITNAAPASATVSADHTLFYGNGTNYGSDIGSTNEIASSDPLFVNPAEWDYHIRIGSPAMDAGAIIPWLITDIDGDARPIGPLPDVGADEISGYHIIHLPMVIRNYP